MQFIGMLICLYVMFNIGWSWSEFLIGMLLFIVVSFLKNPSPVINAVARAAVENRYRNMSSDREIEHLARQYPDLDWVDYVQARESAEKALHEHAEAERQAADAENGEPR